MITFLLSFLFILNLQAAETSKQIVMKLPLKSRFEFNREWMDAVQLIKKNQDTELLNKLLAHYPLKPGLALQEYRKAVFNVVSEKTAFVAKSTQKLYRGNHDCYLRWIALPIDDQTVRPEEKTAFVKKLKANTFPQSAMVFERLKALVKSKGLDLITLNCD